MIKIIFILKVKRKSGCEWKSFLSKNTRAVLNANVSSLCRVFSGVFPSHFHTWLLPTQNLKRVAEVWMDEYAEYIYQRRPEYRHLSAGDVAAQKELRNNLNCKSFKWFMNEVAWDLPKFYPPVEPPAAAWGEASLCSGICSGQTGCGLGFFKVVLPMCSSTSLLWVR